MTAVRTAPPAAELPADHPFHEFRAYLAESRQHLDQIARAIRDNGRPAVLETATITIPAAGFVERSYRVPYAAVAALNLSSAAVIITSAGYQGSAPGGGQGQMTVPGKAWLAQNLSGQTICFYGSPGSQITYSTLVNRIQPSASLTSLSPQITEATPPAPAAGSPLTYTMPFAAQLLAAVFTYTASATAGTRYPTISVLDAAARTVLGMNCSSGVVASTAITFYGSATSPYLSLNAEYGCYGPLWSQIIPEGWELEITNAGGLLAGDQISSVLFVFAT